MTVFVATLEQTGFLFLFILMGYFLAGKKLVPDNSQAVLSKLENYIFIPALVLGTFIENFTPEKITVAAELLLSSLALGLIAIGSRCFVCAFAAGTPMSAISMPMACAFPISALWAMRWLARCFPISFWST